MQEGKAAGSKSSRERQLHGRKAQQSIYTTQWEINESAVMKNRKAENIH